MRIHVPADVPEEKVSEYRANFTEMTKGSGRLMLLAGDQKLEHLNDDFYGPGISEDDADPEHLFRIASKATVGVLAVQYGLVALYGRDYAQVPYLVKLNSKTHLVKSEQKDPYSKQLVSVRQVADLRRAGLRICAVGYTVYIGSEHEHEMLSEATRIVAEAHQEGLLVVIWAYPRGRAVKDEKDPHLIAGAAGAAACLGADFVKVNPPKKDGKSDPGLLREAILAAGRTRLVCAGGSSPDPEVFLRELSEQLAVGTSGNATGRNLHQKSLQEAVRMANAISALTIGGRDVEYALRVYRGQEAPLAHP